MSQSHQEFVCCFLCRRYNPSDTPHKSVDSSLCPASKKDVRSVLRYLARAGKFELYIQRGECLCHACYLQIVEYDTSLVQLLRKQNSLITMVDKAATSFDTDVEAECLEDMARLDKLHVEHFNQYASISDREIAGTIFEAMGGKRYQKKSRVVSSQNNLKHTGESIHISDYECNRENVHNAIQCNLCAMRFKDRSLLQNHVKLVHKKISCTMCAFSHRNEDYVMLHMNLHEGKTENQCRFCSKHFTTKSSTIRHMEVHLDTKKYQCDKCGLCFSQTTMLYTHKLQHEAEENPLHCDICNQGFKTIRTYRHHMVTHKADRPRYTCEHCGKSFTEKYTLKIHKRVHPELLDDSPVRQTQRVDVFQQENREFHISKQFTALPQAPKIAVSFGHVQANKCICIICEQRFNNKDLLDKHMEKQHDVIVKPVPGVDYVQNEHMKRRHIAM